MPCIFNPGYIGPNPPCCDSECVQEAQCSNRECGPCEGDQLCACSPARPETPSSNPIQSETPQSQNKRC